MNILLINHYAGAPDMGMEFRPWYLARKWSEMGHQVFIVAASFAHVRKNQPIVHEPIRQEERDGFTYIWIKTPEYHGNGLGRIRNIYSFLRGLKKQRRRILSMSKPEIVIASSTYPLDNYQAKAMAQDSGAKYIYEIHDLWPLSPMELGGYPSWHPFIMLLQKAENFAYRHADAVVSILPCVKQHVTDHGLMPEKLHLVPNGIWLDDWQNPVSPPPEYLHQIEQKRKEGKSCIAYTGAHGIANALHSFIAATALSAELAVHFFLIGDGPEKKLLEQQAQNMNVTNITFLEPVSKKQIPLLLQSFDALYLGLKAQSLFRFGIGPNKLFDYMMAAKPVIMAIDAGNDIVTEAACGLTIPPENPEALIDALRKMLALSKEERQQMGENGKKYVLEHHNYDILSRKFIQIMKQI